MARDFALKTIGPKVKEYDREGIYPAEEVKKAAELGYTTMFLPEALGGMGLDHVTASIVNEELGRVDAGFAIAVGVSELGGLPIMKAGTEDQKKRLADILVNKHGICSFCLTEADAGSDAAALRTTATKDGEEYIINGTKTFITGGGVADIYTVFTTVDPSLGYKGITCFQIEADRPGVSAGKEEDKMGIRLSNTSEVVFDNVRVPADHMVGKVGQGLQLALGTLNQTRAGGSASVVGTAQHAIDLALDYAEVRKTFGYPIIKNQAVGFMLADMEIKVQSARQMVRYCQQLVDNGIVDARLGAIAKTLASDNAVAICLDAIQIMGGFGYSREYDVEKLLRDAKIYQIFEGTNQIQRMTILGDMRHRKG